jgi:hypothetical protein
VIAARWLLMTLMLAGTLTARASAEGWPHFGKKEATRPTRATLVAARKPSAARPGVLESIGERTNKMLTGTKNFFTPKKKQPKSHDYLSYRPKDQKPSFFQRLFQQQPPPAPETIDDWMALKHIHP